MSVPILHILSGDLWAGKEIQLSLQLAPFLTEPARTFAVQFLLFNDGVVAERLRSLGFVCELVPEHRSRFSMIREFRRTVKRLNPAVIVCHGYKESVFGWLASRTTRVPLVTMFHGAPEPFQGSAAIRMWFYARIHSFIASRYASRIVTVSRALAQELGFESSPKLVVIKNVVAAEIPTPPESERREDVAELVAVGRLVPVKGLERAIRAIACYQNRPDAKPVRLRIVGDGPLRPALERLAADLGISASVNFLGFRTDAAALIADADLLLLPSLREGIPTVVLEAIRSGVPILSHNLPGVREALAYFTDYPAEFQDASDSVVWSEALHRLLGASRLSEGTIRRILASEFAPTVAAARHRQIILELVSGHC